jgi:hypothetical protein
MHRKYFSVLIPMILMVSLGTAFLKPANDRNLKVLPADISDQKLDSIMQTYNVALGVKCQFCHVEMKGFKDSLDYASDKEPMKENARRMMRMTIELNSKYFYFDSTKQPAFLNTVTCKTCHQGEPFPPEN